MSTPRRSFLGRLGALVALGATPSALAAASRDTSATYAPDERWLEALAQREQRVFIETGIISDALAFRRALNFMDVYNTDYATPDARLGVAVALHTAALSFILGDSIWAKYGFGARFGVKTPQGEAATTNPYRAGGVATVEGVASRGVHLLACNRSLMRLSRDLAGPGGNAPAVHAELVAAVLPQAIVVPAVIVSSSRAQQRGVPYIAVA